MTLRAILLLLGVVLVLAACQGNRRAGLAPGYTSIAPVACRPAPPSLAEGYGSRGLAIEECEGAGVYRVFLVSSHANSWLDLVWNGRLFSLEHDILYRQPSGLFPQVEASDPIEWRLDALGRARALILHVSAQEPMDQESPGRTPLSRLFVVRLYPRAACLLDAVATITEARALADGPGDCLPAGAR